MSWQAWFTAGVILTAIAGLVSGRFPPDLVLLTALAALLISGVLTPTEAFQGFASPGLVTVALMYAVAAGLRETGAIHALTVRLFGRARSPLSAQVRLVVPVAVASAFMNTTPLVASFLPVVAELSRRTGVAASRLYMPLAFAAVLGGCCTLIGTSTNLVVHSLILEHNRSAVPGQTLPALSMWTLTWVALPLSAMGLLYMMLAGRRLLPDRGSGLPTLEQARQYTAAMRVLPRSRVVGQTIEGAGLRGLPGLFLSRIERDGQMLVAVDPHQVIRENDVLVFVGSVDSVVDLQKMAGLVPVAHDGESHAHRDNMCLVEAVISPASPLVGRSVRDAEIRTRYSAVVVAVHRHGRRLEGKIGDIVLRPGDTLLLEAAPGFARRHRHSPEFHLVFEHDGAAAPRHRRAPWALAILAGLVLLLSVGVETVVAAMGAAAAMIVARCCTAREARLAVEWSVLLAIGAALGLAHAVKTTGLAQIVAEAFLGWSATQGAWVALAAVYLFTLAFTSFMSNNAAAALAFPFAVQIAYDLDVSFMPFAVGICLAASWNFFSPLGYQAFMMVMGPGGYTVGDFVRFGGPLTLLTTIGALVLIPLAYGLW